MNRPIQVDHPNFILERMQEVCAEKRGYRFRGNPESFWGKNGDQRYSEWDGVECALATPSYSASFNLQQCPGCCAVLVISYVKFQGELDWTQENFDDILQVVEDAAFRAGFGSMMMTQCVPHFSTMFWKGEIWWRCLGRRWFAAQVFMNAKSGNIVTYLIKDLGHKKKVEGLEFVVHPKGS